MYTAICHFSNISIYNSPRSNFRFEQLVMLTINLAYIFGIVHIGGYLFILYIAPLLIFYIFTLSYFVLLHNNGPK